MTASTWNWLLTIAGTIASIAGVVFSWMAWGQAKGAKKAAEEAATTVRTREAADEFLRLAEDAKCLLASAQAGETNRVIEAANNLAHLLMIAGNHRAPFLPEGFSCDLTVENLRKVSTVLASEGFPEASQEKAKLMKRCHQIHESLCGISGAIQRRTEEPEG
jgi:hypothetical protein